MMSLPILEIFLGMLGFGFTILFCTTFCKACSRIREQEREREREQEAWRHSEQDGRPRSIYVIPLSGSMSQDGEDHFRASEYSQELSTLPRYSNAVYFEPPPPYNELACKPDDLPPPYTEYTIPMYPVSPPSSHTPSQTESQP